VAIVPFQSCADSFRGGVVERHVQCAQSAMHLDSAALSGSFFSVALFNELWKQELIKKTTSVTDCKNITTNITSQ